MGRESPILNNGPAPRRSDPLFFPPHLVRTAAIPLTKRLHRKLAILFADRRSIFRRRRPSPFNRFDRCSKIRDFFIRNSVVCPGRSFLPSAPVIRVMSEVSKIQVDSNHGVSMDILKEDMDELNQKKVIIVNDFPLLRDRVIKADADHVVQNLMSCSKTLEDLGKQESEFLSTCNAKRIKLQDDIIELEGRLTGDHDCSSFLDSLDNLISESQEELNSVKKALASKLRETLALKKLLDDVPTQTELIQYERRFSELYINIQDKLRQTRRYYATYNALLEIKDLMLKETSLLNSISSQFQDAITSSTSQMKLIDSMEGILKGIQQKLDKVHLSHIEEQRLCNALKEKYAATTAEQRRGYNLLKAFQDECAKNERLRSQNSM